MRLFRLKFQVFFFSRAFLREYYIKNLNFINKIKDGFLIIDPRIPESWKEYKIRYKYKNSIYIIKIKNNNMVKNVFSNNKEKMQKIKLQDNNKINEINLEI